MKVGRLRHLCGGLFFFLAAHGVRGSTWVAGHHSKNYTDWSSKLRVVKLYTAEDTLGHFGHYDPRVPPSSDRANQFSQAGTDVDVELVVFKVIRVGLPDSRLEVKAWLRMEWFDERLAWDPADFGGIRETFYAATNVPDIELNEIWTPDFTMYNAGEGMGTSFDSALAKVTYDGHVFWSRPGILILLCKYSGIIDFPNDAPICKAEFGGWALSGAYQGLKSFKVNVRTINESATSAPSYASFDLVNVSASASDYVYEHSSAEPWPVALVRFHLRRVNQVSWLLTVVMPAIFLTYLATVVAFIPPESGERLGYGITLVVALEVGKTTLVGIVPIAGEMLVVDMITIVSVNICYLSLFESCLVLYLYYYREEYLLPVWFNDWVRETSEWWSRTCRWHMQVPLEAGVAGVATAKAALMEATGGRHHRPSRKQRHKTSRLAYCRSEWDTFKTTNPNDAELDDWDESGAATIYRAFRQFTLGGRASVARSAELERLWALHYRVVPPGEKVSYREEDDSDGELEVLAAEQSGKPPVRSAPELAKKGPWQPAAKPYTDHATNGGGDHLDSDGDDAPLPSMWANGGSGGGGAQEVAAASKPQAVIVTAPLAAPTAEHSSILPPEPAEEDGATTAAPFVTCACARPPTLPAPTAQLTPAVQPAPAVDS